MKWNKKRSCLVLLGAALCGMVIFLKPEANLKADNTVTTDLPQGKSVLIRNNVGINNPPKRLSLEDIFTLPNKSDSRVDNDVVIITEETRLQEGAVWSTPGNMMDLTKDFEFEAALFFGNKTSNNGDGMTFAMHNDPERLTTKRGINGEKLGVYGQNTFGGTNYTDGALANSFIVEFDTYYNGTASDKTAPSMPHLAYSFPDKSGTYSKATPNVLIHRHYGIQQFNTLATNQWTTFAVNWNAASRTLSYKYGEAAVISVVLDVQDVFGTDQVYWGFTGSTGDAFQHNRAAFTKVPGLVNSESSAAIRDQSGNSVAGKTVEAREVLSYELNTAYLSGKQTWKAVSALITDNPYVDYLAGTLKVNGLTIDEKDFFANKELILGDVSLASPERKITFDVRTKDLKTDQAISEVVSFHGSNYMEDLPAINYTIAKSVVKDGIAIDTIAPFNAAQKITGTWQLENLREMKEVQYQINDGTWTALPKDDYGQNVAFSNTWNVPVSQAMINALDVTKQHTFKIKGVPAVLASGQTDVQASATFAIKPKDLTVTGDVTDKTTSIKGTGTPGLTVQLKNESGTVIKEAVVNSNGDYTLEPLTGFSEGTKLTVSQKSDFAESEPLVIIVAHKVIEPKLTLADAGEKLKLINGATYDIKTQVSGSEADSFVLKYAINGVVNDSLTKVIANPTADQVHSTTTTLPAASLPIGSYTISVSVEWQTGGAKVTAPAIELTVVAGGMKFTQVSAATSFEQGKITNKTQTLTRQDDWNIQIEDFRGKGSQTTLYAKLSTTFKNKDNRTIANPLKYINEQNQEVAMPVGSTVKVFQKETTENFANVDVSWQKNQGILFDLKPGNFQGEYTADIEWLLSDTP